MVLTYFINVVSVIAWGSRCGIFTVVQPARGSRHRVIIVTSPHHCCDHHRVIVVITSHRTRWGLRCRVIVVWQSQWLGPVHSLVFVCVSGFGTALSFLLAFTCLAIALGRWHHILGCARIKGERVQQASGCFRARHSHSQQQRLAPFHALSRHFCIASHTPSSSCRSWSTREHAPSSQSSLFFGG